MSNIRMSDDFRKEIEIELPVKGKKLVVREITMLDFYNGWEKLQQVAGSGQSLAKEITVFAEFVREVFPKVCDGDPNEIMSYGFSILRQIYTAFQEVNSDFLWILESTPLMEYLKVLWRMVDKEIKKILTEVAQEIKQDVSKMQQNRAGRQSEPLQVSLPSAT